MASQQSHNLSHKAGEAVGHAQLKKDEFLDQASNATQQQQSRNTHDQSDNNASYAAQASTFIQQTGEQVKNMAQGAAEAVKSTLGMTENSGNPNNPSNNTSNPNSNNPINRSNNPPSTINNASNPSNNPRLL